MMVRRQILFGAVTSVQEVKRNIYVLSLMCPELSGRIQPGQFLNIKVSPGSTPLLRRPFSVYRNEGTSLEFIFKALGQGTRALSRKTPGEHVDLLGPLGNPYTLEDDYEVALLVAGGLGVAPMPLAAAALKELKIPTLTFLGARTRDELVATHLENVAVATDDGSEGLRGTVVELLARTLTRGSIVRPKIFACGPNAMLTSVSTLASTLGIPCEISLECMMACGFGICQGCPVERVQQANESDAEHKKYYLVCKDGPVFDSQDIIVE